MLHLLKKAEVSFGLMIFFFITKEAALCHLLSLKSSLINAHRDALRANHLSVNSVAKKKSNSPKAIIS